MAMTLTQKTDMYRFFAIAFDAAPGTVYMDQLDAALAGGMTVKQVVNEFTTKPAFTSVYPNFLTNEQFAHSLVENVVGTTASAAAKLEAEADIVGGLEAGMTRGDVIYNVFNNLADLIGDPVWGETAQLLANLVVVAQYYTEVQLGSSTDAATLRDVVSHVTSTSDVSSPAAIEAIISGPVTPPGSSSFILTTDQDNLAGTAGNDTFLATQDSLQTGDRVNGGSGGTDLLDVSVGFGGFHFSAPTLTSIETVKVNAPNVDGVDIGIDLSNSDGVNRLESYQVTDYNGVQEGDRVAFWDIQNVNGTDISIIDTNVDHEFTYDKVNAYDPVALDAVDLLVQEVDGSSITFGNDRPYEPAESNVNVVNLTSLSRTGLSTTMDNTLSGLYVGGDFDTLNIDGGADGKDGNLEIVDTLDRNVRVIDADALNADLTLTADTTNHDDGSLLHTEGLFEYRGAQGKDTFALTRDGNAEILLNDGSDDLTVQGNGNLSVEGGIGNDTVSITAWNDDTPDDNTDNTDDGRHYIDLGTGNDRLSIVGTVDDYNTPLVPDDGTTTIIAGSGHDLISITGLNGLAGEYSINLGADNDTLSIDGDGNQIVVAESGDDQITITGNGNNNVNLGTGADTVTINGDGDQVVVADTGSDSVTINGNGVHNVDLGDDNDYLLVNGGRTVEGNIDYATPADAMTTLVGGLGDDTIDVRFDHYLDVDLGAGDDRLILRAQDLTTDDLIVGGADRTGRGDTLQLSNEEGDDVLVDRSETNSTTGIEVFDLRNQDITLNLSNDNFDTATDRSLTVNTRSANGVDLPLLTAGGVTLHQGMTVEEFTVLAVGLGYTVANGYTEAEARAELVGDLLNRGVNQVDFADNTADGDNTEYTTAPSSIAAEVPQGTSSSISNTNDLVFFHVEPDGYQAVDITGVSLSAASGRSFTLEGGNIRDIVIGDESSINGRATLAFDDPTANNSVEDTLRVMGNATITAADLRNVSGLERIELQSDANSPATWAVELSDRVINQTTGAADLIIRVDTEIASGSKLYITLDPSVHDGSNRNVQIIRNANVSVYINGNIVTEPNYGVTDYDTGTYTITVVNQLIFTSNGDNLVGTAGDDIFTADSLAFIHGAGDTADGLGNGEDEDTLELNFAVNNATNTLQEIFDGADLMNIENIEFNTENNVVFGGIGFNYDTALETLSTGMGDDSLTLMRQGIEYHLNEGDDSIELLNGGGRTTTVYGGSGIDTLWTGSSTGISFGSQSVAIDRVEFVYDADINDSDSATLLSNDSDAPASLISLNNIETIEGSWEDDNVYADSNGGTVWIDGNGGNDTLNVGNNTPSRVTAYGGSGEDVINVLATDYALVYGDDNGEDTVDDAADTINVQVSGANGWASVFGEGGDDNISVWMSSGDNSGTRNMYIEGGDGNDTVYANAFYHTGNGTVLGGNGNDSIVVVAWDFASIDGGNGNDTIVSTWSDANSISGGAGNDSISVNLYYDSSAPANDADYIDGGIGNDTISVNGGNLTVVTIEGGAGDDAIVLTQHLSGIDTLVFGDIDYSALQGPTNGQGVDTITDFNFEAVVGPDPLAPVVQDVLDFNAFLGTGGHVPVAYMTNLGTWEQGVTTVFNGLAGLNDSVVVLSSGDPATQLTANDFSEAGGGIAGTIRLDDGARAVVIVGLDQTGPGSGIGNFDVYYVQDIDSTAGGQTWAVDLVAHIEAATLVGVASVMDNVALPPV